MKKLSPEVSEILDRHRKSLDDVKLVSADLGTAGSCSVKIGDKYIIGIDEDKLVSIAEIHSAILHELGHCRTDSFYDRDAPEHQRIICEENAIQWAILNGVPFDKYIDAIRDGVRDIYQLSDYFNITVSSALKVVNFYETRMLDYIRLAKETTI